MKEASSKSLAPIDWKSLGKAVIGVDEVGRGCLAGPVYAAAVLFRAGDDELPVTDSKKLTERRRDDLAAEISQVHLFQVASSSVEEIDEINILKASLLAMRRAVEGLVAQMSEVERKNIATVPVVIDGHMIVPGLDGLQQIPLVKGDLRCAPVSAASIVAKVSRDRLMKEYGEAFPGYGFEVHKGYLTPFHRQALRELGPTLIHRKTFAGVKELLNGNVRSTELS